VIALLVIQAAAPTLVPGPRIQIRSVQSRPLQEIACEFRTLDFKEPARIVIRQSGGRAYNAEKPGASETPYLTPVTIEVVSDDTGALEKSYEVRNPPNWLGGMAFKIGGSFKYLRFQPVPLGGNSAALIGRKNTLAYVLDIISLQGTGQLVGRCDVVSTPQSPLSAAETKDLIAK
jgi:hypothetical protein